jgi:hypothetical protein
MIGRGVRWPRGAGSSLFVRRDRNDRVLEYSFTRFNSSAATARRAQQASGACSESMAESRQTDSNTAGMKVDRQPWLRPAAAASTRSSSDSMHHRAASTLDFASQLLFVTLAAYSYLES